MASMRGAINKHCKDCIYDSEIPGAWRMQVAACTVSSCALWELRAKSMQRIKSNDENVGRLDESFEV